MRVERLGEGDPDHVVVALLHGDEPAGRRAVEAVLDADPEVRRPVAFVVANERAAERGDPWVDEDLNRAFPGDPAGDSHESRLAAEVAEVVAGRRVLDLHTTVSAERPLAVVTGVDDRTRPLARATGVPQVADLGPVTEGSMVDWHGAGVAVECGRRGTPAATANATAVIYNFLANEGVIAGDGSVGSPTHYRAFDAVEKEPAWRFVAENLVRVDRGEVYAETPDGPVAADRPFYPVLMSTDGYDDVLGFRAERVGLLD
jgi:predicted deacylase